MSLDVDILVSEMKSAASLILTKDIATLKGFSERQIQNIAAQAAFVEQGILSGEITPATKDFFLDNLKDMVRNFIRTLQGLVIVTIEKLWNAIVGVIWKAIGAATGLKLPEIGPFV
jgi:ABC-type iron transport system FetAB ATPase subunit